VITFKVSLYEDRLARGAERDPLYTAPDIPAAGADMMTPGPGIS
jgi:hypothetical protein